MESSSRREENIVSSHATIEILEDADKLLANTMRGEIQPMPLSRCCIYRVPERLRRENEKSFVPEILSIGPFYRGQEKLLGMEKHKAWYLSALLSRMSTPLDTSLECLVKAIRKLEVDARECYPEPINLSSDEFVKMMLLDACFILEYLLILDLDKSAQHENDALFTTVGMDNSLLHDMMLLENQIPFVVVEHLFNLTRDHPEKGGCSLDELLIRFINAITPTIGSVQNNSNIKGKHLLDILRGHHFTTSQQVDIGDHPVWEYTHSATDLVKAGVNFKKRENADSLLDITFSKDGVFEIPPFCLDSLLVDYLRNLIAFEQCDKNNKLEISSYVVLLDILVNCEQDVSLLRHKGIIENYFMDDDEAALTIHKLCIGVIARPFHYDGLCHRVNAYYRKDWNKWRATLKRDYFNTPWAILSFIAAIILLLLTLAQTIFSILP